MYVRQHEYVRTLERAGDEDAEALLALREGAAAWLSEMGVRQWEPGEVSMDEIRGQVIAGEWHLLRDGADPIGALRLLWADEGTWGRQPPVAAYVHGLVIDGRRRGSGLGTELLGWAAAEASRAGRELLRLDCGEENHALQAYYARHGFQIVGRRDFTGQWYSVVLLEKDIGARVGTVAAWLAT